MEPYNWHRFWCLRTSNIDLSDGGYLVDPESDWGKYVAADFKSLSQILSFPFLGLLGEPGIGKSVTLSEIERPILDKEIEKRGELSLWLDLRSYSDEDALIKEIFDNSSVKEWLSGPKSLHVFLDSMDEGLLHIKTLSALLIDRFLKKVPVGRLHLRVACRTAVWPDFLETEAARLWGKDNINVFELCPLRRKDVIAAAQREGIDSDEFIKKVSHKSLMPLAIKPVTLRFLINTFKQNQNFPSTQGELYEKGCLYLCEERNPARRSSSGTNVIDDLQKLSIASRIAAATIFANKYAIWTGADSSAMPPEDIHIRELCGDDVMPDGQINTIEEGKLRQVLDTGLFTSRGPNRMGWSHKTYAEFLAARYITIHKLSISQILPLIVHGDDAKGKLVPQLYETAAWLCSNISELFEITVKNDPESILVSDVITATEQHRVQLLTHTLDLLKSGEVISTRFMTHDILRKLNYLGIETPLRAAITDKKAPHEMRSFAIDTAAACEVRALQHDLLTMAMDYQDDIYLRQKSVGVLVNVADPATRLDLIPLLKHDPADEDDQLKGQALRALWPSTISAEQLFKSITMPRKENFIGSYQYFLLHELLNHIKDSDWVYALNWIKSSLGKHAPHSIEQLTAGIFINAWNSLNLPNVLQSYAEALHSYLVNGHEFMRAKKTDELHQKINQDEVKRRDLIKKLVEIHPKDEKMTNFFWVFHSGIISSSDCPWAIQQALNAIDTYQKTLWIEIVRRVALNWDDTLSTEALLMACSQDDEFKATFAWFITPVTLNSEEALRTREEYRKANEWRERPKKSRAEVPPIEGRALSRLQQYENGDLNAWWMLTLELLIDPDTGRYAPYKASVNDSSGWMTVDDKIRSRILSAAEVYIKNFRPDAQKTLKDLDLIHQPNHAGYRAFHLLASNKPEALSPLSKEVWVKWAPIITAMHLYAEETADPIHTALLKNAYQYAELETLNTLSLAIKNDNVKFDHIFVVEKFESFMDEKISSVIFEAIGDGKLKSSCTKSLLSILLRNKYAPALTYARSFIKEPLPAATEDQDIILNIALELMANTSDASWSLIWPLIKNNKDFGQRLLEAAAHSSRHEAGILSRLSEKDLSELFCMLSERYPYPDPERETGFIGPAESLRMWKNSILNNLVEKGTIESCKEIEMIKVRFPNLDWIKWVVLRADTQRRRKKWAPPLPAEILQLAQDKRLRLIQSGDDLQSLLLESFKRALNRLQGETPQVFALWNESKNDQNQKEYTPKSETFLSDWLKDHLSNDLKEVLVNREVEIRRGQGGAPGERTDLHVSTFPRLTNKGILDPIKVIIEVKGCWNSSLETDMQKQLRDRYLKDNECRHGIYLIGWYYCVQWEIEKKSLNDASCFFSEQADRLSTSEVKIKSFVLNTALR